MAQSRTGKGTAKLLPVELGYVEESDSCRLSSHFFPSKVGGKPAWLSFKPVPTCESVRCGVCGEPCVFLLQVYAPLETASTFHRTLFVFVCRNPQCCTANNADNVVILRCQLPRENEFYSTEPVNADEVETAREGETDESGSSILDTIKRQDDYKGNKLCVVCAVAADKHCGQCKEVYYCCKSHQELDWKSGGHKDACGKSEQTKDRRNTLRFPEMELVIEKEHYVEKKKKERPESERLRAYEEFVQQQRNENNAGGGGNGVVNGMSEESVQHLEAIAKAADKDFKMFRRRIEQNPEQVLRYQLGGEPLWADRTNVPSDKKIPQCPLCNGPRTFEFQIMPHLLSYLDVDSLEKSLDWATVAVYTCKQSCDIPENGYTREWAWKQDFEE